MCYMHSLDILHADLTGSNILLCSSDADERGFIAKVGRGMEAGRSMGRERDKRRDRGRGRKRGRG